MARKYEVKEEIMTEEQLQEMARKVSDAAVNALLKHKNFNSRNTKVRREGDKTHIYLHDNRIATHHADGSITGTAAGWESRTTNERLNALSDAVGGGRFHMVKHRLHHNGKPISPNDEVTLRKPMNEETMDPVTEGIKNVLEGNLEQMRQNFNQALAQKAVEKIEEKKLEISSNYFGNE